MIKTITDVSSVSPWTTWIFHSHKWSISNFPCSLTRNITSHSIKNLAFHRLLRWKMIILLILSLPHLYISLFYSLFYSIQFECQKKAWRTYRSLELGRGPDDLGLARVDGAHGGADRVERDVQRQDEVALGPALQGLVLQLVQALLIRSNLQQQRTHPWKTKPVVRSSSLPSFI